MFAYTFAAAPPFALAGTFYKASAFNQPLEQWSVGRVTDMGKIFYQASEFNQPLNQWDVGRVTTLYCAPPAAPRASPSPRWPPRTRRPRPWARPH